MWGLFQILFIYLFLIYFLDYAITVVPFFFSPLSAPLPAPLFSSTLHLSSHQHSPPQFMSMGRTCKFFGFSTSPCLSCIYQLRFLFFVPFAPLSPLPIPTYNPPCDLHFCESIPVLVFCLVCFCFGVFFLGFVVDNCEFVILLIIVLIIFFLDKSL